MHSHPTPIADVQGSVAKRLIPINQVGIRSLKHPVDVFLQNGTLQHTVGELSMYVDLPAHQRGTHMSRFIELLGAAPLKLTAGDMEPLILAIQDKLQASAAYFEAQFTLFLPKTAPISKEVSLMDYTVQLWASSQEGVCLSGATVIVPVTSLCPCSKEISEYGAHNQRSHITMDVECISPIDLEELILIAEKEASCEVFAMLKRPDEKYVTERAYNHPKFVEDLVRDIASKLNLHTAIRAYTVSSENFESIHNHSAFAEITQRKY